MMQARAPRGACLRLSAQSPAAPYVNEYGQISTYIAQTPHQVQPAHRGSGGMHHTAHGSVAEERSRLPAPVSLKAAA